MPLFSNFRVDGRQAIGLVQSSVAAKRTATTFDPVLYNRFPLMVISLGTLPPDLLAAAGSYVSWRQVSVFSRMPFLCNLWVSGSQTSRSRCSQASATGASGSTHSAHDTRFPFMVIPLGALPPYLLVTTRPNILRAQIPILHQM